VANEAITVTAVSLCEAAGFEARRSRLVTRTKSPVDMTFLRWVWNDRQREKGKSKKEETDARSRERMGGALAGDAISQDRLPVFRPCPFRKLTSGR